MKTKTEEEIFEKLNLDWKGDIIPSIEDRDVPYLVEQLTGALREGIHQAYEAGKLEPFWPEVKEIKSQTAKAIFADIEKLLVQETGCSNPLCQIAPSQEMEWDKLKAKYLKPEGKI